MARNQGNSELIVEGCCIAVSEIFRFSPASSCCVKRISDCEVCEAIKNFRPGISMSFFFFFCLGNPKATVLCAGSYPGES